MFKVQAPVDFVMHCMSSIENIPKGLEERDKLRCKTMLNISADSQMRLITASASGAASVNEEREEVPIPTSIADVANRMGIKKLKDNDYQQIGKIAKKLYMAAHNGNVPTQHSQRGANGQWFMANDYYMTDEPILKDAIDEFTAKQKIKEAWNKVKEDDYKEIDKIAKRMFMALHIGDMPTQRSQRTFNEKWIMANDLHIDEDRLLRDAVSEHLSKRKK
jgi:hypothetical protein